MTTMKSTSAFAFLALLTMATATSAFAQHALQGNVPFNFVVGDKVLPAGEYVTYAVNDHLLEIQSPDRQISVAVACTHNFVGGSGGSRLEFDRIGGSYFLHRVLSNNPSELSVNVPLGRSAKIARERTANPPPDTSVLVAMR